MGKKRSKKEEAEAKALRQLSDEAATKANSETARVDVVEPQELGPEAKIVADNIEKEDEATMVLTGSHPELSAKKICPKCGTENRQDRVTCTNCKSKFYSVSEKVKDIKAKKEKAQAKVKIEKEAKAERYGRQDSVADAIKQLKTFTVEELIGSADAMMVAHGGQANPKETKTQVEKAVALLSRLGSLKIDGDKMTYTC